MCVWGGGGLFIFMLIISLGGVGGEGGAFSNIHMKLLTSTLHDLSVSAIPKTSSVAKKLHKPWCNDECQEACTNRKKALKLFKRQPSSENLNKFKYLYAKARRTSIQGIPSLASPHQKL